MNKELFEIIITTLRESSIDAWESEKTSILYLKKGPVLLNENGDLRVNNLWQTPSWRQRRRLKNLHNLIQQEIATRAIQRAFE